MENIKERIITQLSNMSKTELIEIFICAVEEIELLTKNETALNFLDSVVKPAGIENNGHII